MTNFKTKRNFFQGLVLLGMVMTMVLPLAYLNIDSLIPIESDKDLIDTPRTSAIQDINITSPENKTYTAPMNGYYPATHGFENEAIGTSDASIQLITYWNSNPSQSLSIISESDGHLNIMRNIDGSSSYGHYSSFGHLMNSPQGNGTIEFWIKSNNVNDRWGISLQNASIERVFQYRIDAGYHVLSIYGGNTYNLVSASNDQWYHIQIHFEMTSGNYQGLDQNQVQVCIDDTPYAPQYAVFPSNILNLHMGSNSSAIATVDLDAFGFSWDPDYSIGDNLNEGLLLSYENGTNLEWTGYSLDGQSNVTISGNKTIPIPEDGHHTIQLFGNESLGSIYESEIKHFDVDINAPTSSISFTPYSEANIVVKTTKFTIAADDGLGSGVSIIKYRINNSGWIDYIGPFDLSDYDPGRYNISYYSIDTVNHVETLKAVLVVLIEVPPGTEIPGYDMFLVVGIICIVSIYILKKRYKIIK